MFLEITLSHSNFGGLGEFPSKRGQKDTPEHEDVGAQGNHDSTGQKTLQDPGVLSMWSWHWCSPPQPTVTPSNACSVPAPPVSESRADNSHCQQSLRAEAGTAWCLFQRPFSPSSFITGFQTYLCNNISRTPSNLGMAKWLSSGQQNINGSIIWDFWKDSSKRKAFPLPPRFFSPLWPGYLMAGTLAAVLDHEVTSGWLCTKGHKAEIWELAWWHHGASITRPGPPTSEKKSLMCLNTQFFFFFFSF